LNGEARIKMSNMLEYRLKEDLDNNTEWYYQTLDKLRNREVLEQIREERLLPAY